MKVVLSRQARELLDSLPVDLDKAQIRGVLRRLAEEDETLESWDTPEFAGGRFSVAGPNDAWRISYHVVELDEPVISVVTIRKRRTIPFALRFYPRKNSDD